MNLDKRNLHTSLIKEELQEDSEIDPRDYHVRRYSAQNPIPIWKSLHQENFKKPKEVGKLFIGLFFLYLNTKII